ncbi:MAG: (Fe-S)-binding protein, partial [Acidobacteriota bacterium]|nr:(Fe-S)-binding protein [Acidobacteriota bacterium]
MHRTPSQFKILASENVADPRLRRTFQSATGHALGQRARSVQLVPEWEDLRERAHRIKEEAVEHLDVYLEKLEASVIRRGGRVFWARDAGEASRYVVDLCRRLQASTVVKSKSMAA